jgi:hypothetical protein
VCFINSAVKPTWNKESLSPPWKIPPSKKYSFQKLTQFSRENNLLDAAACNKDVFLREIHGFFNSAEYISLEQTEPNSTFKHQSCTKGFLSKTDSFSQGNYVLDASASNTDGFFEIYLYLSTHQHILIWKKMRLPTHMGSFQDIYVFHQLSCRSIFLIKRTYLHPGKPT